MITVTTLPDLRQALTRFPKPIGLVPTMGYLHEGHLSLLRTAKNECATVAVSIFVNPTQFGQNEDLSAYPRDLPHDLQLLEREAVDLVWTPVSAEIYPQNFQTWVDVEEITKHLEGAQRPGHFRGVATVVAKLFNALQPQMAFFGQKDAQQVAVVRQMVRDLNFPIEIVVCPTVRESDGLAMSSRNSYLNHQERQAAPILYKALNTAQTAFQSGERQANAIRQIMRDTIKKESLATIQYVSCADPDTLLEIGGVIDGRVLLSMAVYIGKTRLIDNFLIG